MRKTIFIGSLVLLAPSAASEPIVQVGGSCSIRCEGFKSPEVLLDSDFDTEGIEKTLRQIQNTQRASSSLYYMYKAKSYAASFVPVVGGALSNAAADAGSVIRKVEAANLARLVEHDVRRRLSLGSTGQREELKLRLRNNTASTIKAIIGPESHYKEIYKDADAYDRLQDAAIEYLAEKMDDIIDAQNDNLGDLSALKKNVAQNHERLKSLKDALEEQARSSNDGQGGDTPEEALAKEVDQARSSHSKGTALSRASLKRAQEVGQSARIISEQFGAAAQIAQNLKMDSEIVKGISDVSKAAQVVEAFSAAAVSPYAVLPALGLASGLLGSGSPGPTADTALILAELQKIQEQLEEIERKIDLYHQEEMAQLSTILGEVRQIQIVQRADNDSKLNRCGWGTSNAVGEPNYARWTYFYGPERPAKYAVGFRVLRNPSDLRPMDWSTAKVTYSTHFRDIESCLDTLSEYFLGDGQISPRFFAASSKPAEEISNEWLPAISMIAERTATREIKTAQLDSLLWSFARPSPTMYDLEQRVGVSNVFSTTDFEGLTPNEISNYETLLGQPIDVELVARSASYLVRNVWWNEFLAPGQKLNLASGASQASKINKIRADLRQAENALRLSIAQFNSLSGDVLLPVIYESWNGSSSIPDLFASSKENLDWWSKDAQSEFEKLMSLNGIAVRNYGAYFARVRLREKGKNSLQYRYALQSKSDDFLLRQTLGNPHGKYQLIEDRWTMVREIEKNKFLVIPLPEEHELNEGVILHHPFLKTLIETISQVEREQYLYSLGDEPEKIQNEVRDLIKLGLM